jgi:hypothetical protein
MQFTKSQQGSLDFEPKKPQVEEGYPSAIQDCILHLSRIAG